MPVKEIIIHAGLHKTGTSSIQNTLFYNKTKLNKNGFYYMSPWGSNHSGVVFDLFSDSDLNEYHYNLLNGYNSDSKIKKANEKNLSFLYNKEILKYEKLIISGEDISLMNEGSLQQMKATFLEIFGAGIDIKIIIYVRNPIDLAVSRYQQLIIAPENGISAAEYINSLMGGFFENHITKFTSVFGSEKVNVVEFEATIKSAGLVESFLSEIGINDNEISKMNIIKSNESKCKEAVEFASYVNEICPFFYKKGSKLFLDPKRKSGDTNILSSIKGEKFDLPKVQKETLYKQVKDDVLWLKYNYKIDYSPKTEFSEAKEAYDNTYSPNTITDFLSIFDQLSYPLKEFFLSFFKRKFLETGNNKFKPLFDENSIPYNNLKFTKALTPLMNKNEMNFLEENKANTLSNCTEPDFLEVFIDYGNGLDYENVVRFYHDNKRQIIMDIEFTDSKIYKLRIDPTLYASVVLVEQLLINGSSQKYEIEHTNSIFNFNKTFVFFQDDPQIYIKAFEKIRTLKLVCYIDKGTYPFSMGAKKLFKDFEIVSAEKWRLSDYLDAVLEEKKDILKQLETVSAEKWRLSDYLDAVLEEKKDILKQLETVSAEKWRLSDYLDAVLEEKRKLVEWGSELDIAVTNANAEITLKEKMMEKQKELFELSKEIIAQKSIEISEKEEELNQITGSTSWKVTKPFRTAVSFIKKHI